MPSNAVVSLCLRQRESFVRWVVAPLSSPRKARRVFHSLLDIQLPFSVEDCVFDIVDIREGADGHSSRGLAAGARNADIERRLQALDPAMPAPHILDQESAALWTQALAEAPATEPDAPRAVVYESDDRFTLVVGRGDELLGAHAFKAFDPDTLNRTLRLYFPVAPQALQWLWTGPSATRVADVTARHAALTGRWPGSLSVAEQPEAFLARALATRALTAGPLRFDARRGRHAHPAVDARDRRAPLIAAGACLCVGLLLCAVNIAWNVGLSKHRDRLQTALRQAAIRVAGSERLVPRGQERLGAQRAAEERARLAAPLVAPFQPSVLAAIGPMLAAAQAEGLRVQNLTATRSLTTAHATARTWSQCERVVSQLDKQGWQARAERKGEAGERMNVVITVEAAHGQ